MSLQALNRGFEAQEAYRRAKTTNSLNPELTAFADQRLRQLQ
jgi:MSHA biogenesis protein MshN